MMKKKKLLNLIIFIFLLINLCGCTENNVNNESKTIFVDDDVGKDYNTIQDAINKANEGDTVYVHNGKYNELIIINKSLKLIGESKNKTIIMDNVNTYEQNDLIIINTDNSSIRNFKIVNTLSSSSITGVRIKSSHNIISNVTIINTTNGISIEMGSKNNRIYSNQIINNEFGIDLRYSDNNNISENNISENKFSGIYIKGLLSHNNSIFSNTISNNYYGIYLTGSNNNKIFNNKIINNQKEGMHVCCDSKNNILYNNVFKKNGDLNANDDGINQWYFKNIGNYWDDYKDKYPNSTEQNGIWNKPYNISGGKNQDNYPLVNIDIN